MLIAHLADIHLGITPYRLQWVQDAIIEHFSDAIDKAIEEHVDAIVIAGDLFNESRPKNKIIKKTLDILSKAYSKGIKLYGVLGDHDLPKARDIPPQALIPFLRIPNWRENKFVDEIMIDGKVYHIAGVNNMPLRQSKRMKERLIGLLRTIGEAVNKKSILIMHQNIVNYFMFEEGISLSDIPDKPIYVAMGHIHRRIIDKRSSGQVIAYPGSLDILKENEIKHWKKEGKGFYLVDLSGDEAEVTPVDIEVVPQEIVESDVNGLATEIARAIHRLPSDKRAVLHIKVLLSTREKTDVYALVKRIIGRYSANISFKIRKQYVDVPLKITDTGVEGTVDEKTVIAEILGGSQYIALAEKILMLKQALIHGSEKDVYILIDEIAKDSYWDTKIPYKITLPKRVMSGTSVQRKITSKKGILSFISEG